MIRKQSIITGTIVNIIQVNDLLQKNRFGNQNDLESDDAYCSSSFIEFVQIHMNYEDCCKIVLLPTNICNSVFSRYLLTKFKRSRGSVIRTFCYVCEVNFKCVYWIFRYLCNDYIIHKELRDFTLKNFTKNVYALKQA